MTLVFLLAEPFLIVFSTILISILPCWMLVCRFRLEPLERLVVSVLAGFALMCFLEFGAYLLSLPSWMPFIFLLTISLLATLKLFFRPQSGTASLINFPWAGVIAWLVIVLLAMAVQFQIVVYGAQLAWAGDWWEHYQRSLFFLKQLPHDTLFMNGVWALPARGPLFNAVAGLIMGGFGDGFWVYQVIATVLNSFCVLPMALLLQKLSKLQLIPSLIISILVFALVPFALQQIIYPWTKMFTTGFILAGIYFYIEGLESRKENISAWAFVIFSLGVLAHYMTVLFAIFFLIHFIALQIKNPRILKNLISPIIVCFLVLSSWVFYLIPTYGIKGTLASTLRYEYKIEFNKKLGAELSKFQVFWGNTLSTFVPFSFRHDWQGLGKSTDLIKLGWSFQPKDQTEMDKSANARMVWKLDLINDQSSIMGNIGYSAGVIWIAILLFLIRTKDPHVTNSQGAVYLGWKFWILFFILGSFLNIWIFTIYSVQGLSYVSFQPYLCLLLVFSIRGLLVLPGKIKFALLGLYFFESTFKSWIWIQMHLRPIKLEEASLSGLIIRGPELNAQYVANYLGKVNKGFYFLSDQFINYSQLLSFMSLGIILVMVASLGAIRILNSKRQKGEVVG
jgi:hypothetical protein